MANLNLFRQLFFYPQLAYTFVAMARFALLLMCFTILFQSVQRTWIVASWKMNQSYIASELCEKRFEEKSCCAGSCFLNKELKENEQQEQSAPTNEKNKSELVCDVFAQVIDQIEGQAFFSGVFPIVWKDGQPVLYSSSVFHPPSLKTV